MTSKKRSKKVLLSDYFRYHRLLFNVLGIWTDMQLIAGSLYPTVAYSILCFSFLIIAPQFCHVIYMYKARDNVVAFADEFYVSVASVVVIFKDFSLIKHRHVILEMLEIMDTDIMQPTQVQKKQMDVTMNFWKVVSIAMVSLLHFFSFGQLIAPALDRITLGLMTFCAAECDVLSENLAALGSEEFEPEYKRKLIKCIKHHESLHRLTTNLETSFSTIILALYFCSLISCCTSMFKLSLAEPFSVEFYKVVIYILFVLLQIFVYCSAASDLTEKSEKLPWAIYEGFREDLSKNTKTNIQLFIGKTQKPLKLRTLLFDLSMQQYLQLIRSSFSYYTMLTTLNEQ